MSDEQRLPPPPGEPTYAEPDQQDTLDALSPRARAARQALHQAEGGAAKEAKEGNAAAASGAPFDGMRIGRYQLLEMVGAGGMGMVWGAWDPELERRVALKLVQPTVAEARERILTEGQALAKLSHPNVVPIYDVGVMGTQVYLVMEWVRGTTLRAYARTAGSARELVAAYRQAGQGLAAAHRAGIVHRDFKPDNVIHGDDGRTRVLDFGLAQSGGKPAAAAGGSPGASPAGAGPGGAAGVAGTPRYMAPEQARGDAAVAATDQYAFAFSLHEALGELAKRGEKIPGWIAAILARGMAREPAQRFASMDELLAALERDPAKRWRRRAAVVAVAAASAAAFAVGRQRGSDVRVEPCAGSGAAIAAAWSEARRDEVIAHLGGLGVLGGDEPARLARDLDDYRDRWVEAHRGSCLARERRELTPILYERRLACLARGQASLAAVAELLASVPAEGLAQALIARRELPAAEACAAVDDSAVMPPPPELAGAVAAVVPRLERARVLGVAQRPEALAEARAAVTAARATGYLPLVARALLVQGRAEPAAVATTTLTEALALALQSFDDVLALEAYARWVWVAEYRDPPDGWLVMTQLAQRAGAPGRFGRALLFNNLGGRHYRAKQRDKARELLTRALGETELAAGKDPDDVELVSILRNLALIEPDAGRRQELMERAAGALARALGPSHPSALTAREQTAMLTRAPGEARRKLEEACLGYGPWRLAAAQAVCALESAWLADEAGDRAAALRWMQLAASDPKTAAGDRIKGKIAAGYLLLYGAPAASGAALASSAEALLASAKAALASPNWWFTWTPATPTRWPRARSKRWDAPARRTARGGRP